MDYGLLRWWLSFSVISIMLLTALFAGLGEFIYSTDVTGLSWLVLFVFFVGSINLGFNMKKPRLNGYRVPIVTYSMDTCTSIGLLGTVIGLILMIVGGFSSLDVNDHESIKTALLSISSGIGTSLVTTLVGLVCAILSKFQLVISTGGNYNND